MNVEEIIKKLKEDYEDEDNSTNQGGWELDLKKKKDNQRKKNPVQEEFFKTKIAKKQEEHAISMSNSKTLLNYQQLSRLRSGKMPTTSARVSRSKLYNSTNDVSDEITGRFGNSFDANISDKRGSKKTDLPRLPGLNLQNLGGDSNEIKKRRIIRPRRQDTSLDTGKPINSTPHTNSLLMAIEHPKTALSRSRILKEVDKLVDALAAHPKIMDMLKKLLYLYDSLMVVVFADLNRLESSNLYITKDVGPLTSQVRDYSIQCSDLSKKNSKLKRKLEALINSHEKEITGLRATHKEEITNLHISQKRATYSLEKKLEKSKELESKLAQKIRLYKDRLKNAGSSLAEIEMISNNQKIKIEELEGDLQTIHSSNSKLANKIQSKNKKLSIANESIATLQGKIDVLTQINHDCKSRMEELKDELINLRNVNDELKHENEKASNFEADSIFQNSISKKLKDRVSLLTRENHKLQASKEVMYSLRKHQDAARFSSLTGIGREPSEGSSLEFSQWILKNDGSAGKNLVSQNNTESVVDFPTRYSKDEYSPKVASIKVQVLNNLKNSLKEVKGEISNLNVALRNSKNISSKVGILAHILEY